MIDSRDIKELDPRVSDMCSKFIAKCHDNGIKVIITSTFRDNEKQTALYNQGRTTSGKIVTKAKSGQSMHNYRLAFDFCPIVNGKAEWNNLTLFKTCGDIGKSLGLSWGGDWISFKDFPHLEWSNGLSIRDLQDGKKP